MNKTINEVGKVLEKNYQENEAKLRLLENNLSKKLYNSYFKNNLNTKKVVSKVQYLDKDKIKIDYYLTSKTPGITTFNYIYNKKDNKITSTLGSKLLDYAYNEIDDIFNFYPEYISNIIKSKFDVKINKTSTVHYSYDRVILFNKDKFISKFYKKNSKDHYRYSPNRHEYELLFKNIEIDMNKCPDWIRKEMNINNMSKGTILNYTDNVNKVIGICVENSKDLNKEIMPKNMNLYNYQDLISEGVVSALLFKGYTNGTSQLLEIYKTSDKVNVRYYNKDKQSIFENKQEYNSFDKSTIREDELQTIEDYLRDNYFYDDFIMSSLNGIDNFKEEVASKKLVKHI